MNNQNNLYYQQQPMMQQPQGAMPPRMPLQHRMTKGARAIQNVFPKWLSTYPIVTYILALMVVSFMYSSHSMPWYYMLSGVLAMLVFFLLGSTFATRNSVDNIRKERRFERRIFLIAFIPRMMFMLLLYWIFQANYGDAFGFENGDALVYHETGEYVAGLIAKGNFHFYDELSRYLGIEDIADMGFDVYLGFVYYLTDNSIIASRILKCIWSSLTVVLIYRLTKRNFGDQVARYAAIFCALWINFWYYCAVELKETEMVFVCTLFIEQADQMLRSRKFTAWKVVPVLILAASLFTFRTVLGIVAIMALLFSIVMSSTKVVSWGKRIIVGGLAVTLVLVTMGNQIEERTRDLYEQAQSKSQEENMEWRANRKDLGGTTQSFAKYAGAAVFAPMIFTLPFPTMVDVIAGQEKQQLQNGGYFTKNILSCFVIFAVVMLMLTGKWREHLLPLSFIIGYLVVLVMSNFAHSDRFHQPVMPFEFMFAAYGLSIAVTNKKYKRWFLYGCIVMFIAALAWNWFKMAGRGLA